MGSYLADPDGWEPESTGWRCPRCGDARWIIHRYWTGGVPECTCSRLPAPPGGRRPARMVPLGPYDLIVVRA